MTLDPISVALGSQKCLKTNIKNQTTIQNKQKTKKNETTKPKMEQNIKTKDETEHQD